MCKRWRREGIDDSMRSKGMIGGFGGVKICDVWRLNEEKWKTNKAYR